MKDVVIAQLYNGHESTFSIHGDKGQFVWYTDVFLAQHSVLCQQLLNA